MRPLSTAELLHVWEQGLGEPAGRRSLPLLTSACEDIPPEAIAILSIGERDSRLLKLREWTFGPELLSVTSCPACGEQLGWSTPAANLSVSAPGDWAKHFTCTHEDYEVTFRLPNIGDVLAASEFQNVESARRCLLRNCLIDARKEGVETAPDELPDSVVESVIRQMSEADPQADLEIDLACPACDHRWQASFDIESFFWSELSAWAKRLLGDVHILASAYGWPESDILNLPPQRRQVYLDLVNA
jgi:hypothetical protein